METLDDSEVEEEVLEGILTGLQAPTMIVLTAKAIVFNNLLLPIFFSFTPKKPIRHYSSHLYKDNL